MMAKNSRVTLHMVSGLDGFIAKKDSNISWLQSTDKYDNGVTLTDKQVADFLDKIDCYIMGSKTFEKAEELGWPYGDIPVIVMTHRNLVSDRKNVQFHSGDPADLINTRLKPIYHNIWLVGGAVLARDFLRLHLVDDIIIAVMPVILGGGTPFFDNIGLEKPLHLKDVTAYKDGMVELWYEVQKDQDTRP